MRHRAYDTIGIPEVIFLLTVGGWGAAPAFGAPATGQTPPIVGTNPYATGTLGILNPDNASLSTSVVYQVDFRKKPTDFKPDSSGLTAIDDEGDYGDTPGTPPVMGAQAFNLQTWVWTRDDNKILTPEEQALAFSAVAGNANRTRYTVRAGIPVEFKTQHGDPRRQVSPLQTPTYTVEITTPPPVIRVNGTTFAWNSGFPTTGFVGAQFQLYMNGVNTTANSNYTYRESGNQTWVDIPASNAVGTEGTFTFIDIPSIETKTLKIIATNKKHSADEHTLDITLGRWFINGGSASGSWATQRDYCQQQPGGYSTPSVAYMTTSTNSATPARSAVGPLWNEWGILTRYGPSSGWANGYYWASDTVPGGQSRVRAESGGVGITTSNRSFSACAKDL